MEKNCCQKCEGFDEGSDGNNYLTCEKETCICHTTQEPWEERFNPNSLSDGMDVDWEKVKAFISSLLSDQKKGYEELLRRSLLDCVKTQRTIERKELAEKVIALDAEGYETFGPANLLETGTVLALLQSVDVSISYDRRNN